MDTVKFIKELVGFQSTLPPGWDWKDHQEIPEGMQESAEYIKDQIVELGNKIGKVTEERVDEAGNVYAYIKMKGSGKTVLFNAHHDVAQETFKNPCEFKVEDDKIYGPGVDDDICGVATVLQMLDTIEPSTYQPGGIEILISNFEESTYQPGGKGPQYRGAEFFLKNNTVKSKTGWVIDGQLSKDGKFRIRPGCGGRVVYELRGALKELINAAHEVSSIPPTKKEVLDHKLYTEWSTGVLKGPGAGQEDIAKFNWVPEQSWIKLQVKNEEEFKKLLYNRKFTEGYGKEDDGSYTLMVKGNKMPTTRTTTRISEVRNKSEKINAIHNMAEILKDAQCIEWPEGDYQMVVERKLFPYENLKQVYDNFESRIEKAAPEVSLKRTIEHHPFIYPVDQLDGVNEMMKENLGYTPPVYVSIARIDSSLFKQHGGVNMLNTGCGGAESQAHGGGKSYSKKPDIENLAGLMVKMYSEQG